MRAWLRTLPLVEGFLLQDVRAVSNVVFTSNFSAVTADVPFVITWNDTTLPISLNLTRCELSPGVDCDAYWELLCSR